VGAESNACGIGGAIGGMVGAIAVTFTRSVMRNLNPTVRYAASIGVTFIAIIVLFSATIVSVGIPIVIATLIDNQPILNANFAASLLCYLRLMGDHHDRNPLLMQIFKQTHHILRSLGI
jgi:hypothetical protein